MEPTFDRDVRKGSLQISWLYHSIALSKSASKQCLVKQKLIWNQWISCECKLIHATYQFWLPFEFFPCISDWALDQVIKCCGSWLGFIDPIMVAMPQDAARWCRSFFELWNWWLKSTCMNHGENISSKDLGWLGVRDFISDFHSSLWFIFEELRHKMPWRALPRSQIISDPWIQQARWSSMLKENLDELGWTCYVLLQKDLYKMSQS